MGAKRTEADHQVEGFEPGFSGGEGVGILPYRKQSVARCSAVEFTRINRGIDLIRDPLPISLGCGGGIVVTVGRSSFAQRPLKPPPTNLLPSPGVIGQFLPTGLAPTLGQRPFERPFELCKGRAVRINEFAGSRGEGHARNRIGRRHAQHGTVGFGVGSLSDIDPDGDAVVGQID